MVEFHRCLVMPRIAAISILPMFAAQAAPAATPDPHLQTLRSELIARGDPDSLAAAAVMERSANGQWQDAADLAARASAAAPRRADLAYLQLNLCYQVPSCDIKPIELRLRRLDPTNGITWLYVLNSAIRANDEPQAREALTDMAQAQRVAIYWTDLVSHLTAAITGRGGLDAGAAFTEVVGVTAALVTPSLNPISNNCSQSLIVDDDVLTQCRRIFAAFIQSDSSLFASYGNHKAARLWPAGSPESDAIAAASRSLDYRQNLWTVKADTLNSAKATTLLAALYPKYPTEDAVLRAWYLGLGLEPEPPPDWKPPSPGG